MKRYARMAIILAILLCLIAAVAPAHADDEPEVIIIEAAPTSSPTPPALTPPPSPTPTAQPTPLPTYDFDGRDVAERCMSRANYRIVPDAGTETEKRALDWVILNRLDDTSGKYADEVRYILLQKGEFLDYDPDAPRTPENTAIAASVLNAWRYEQITGDSTYRLVPKSGVKCDFYTIGKRAFITVYDADDRIVYDSGGGAA